MGNFVGVYSEEPDRLNAVVGAKDKTRLAEILAANQQLQKNEILACLTRLIDGDFTPGEQPGGGSFVYAFEAICKTYAISQATVEIYLDEDMFPEIWDFVWSAADTPLALPVSEHGSPAVGYWDHAGVKKYIGVFAELDLGSVMEKAGSRYESEIAELLTVLRSADKAARGIYVFFNE